MRADLLKLIKRESESFVLIQPVDLTLARRRQEVSLYFFFFSSVIFHRREDRVNRWPAAIVDVRVLRSREFIRASEFIRAFRLDR